MGDLWNGDPPWCLADSDWRMFVGGALPLTWEAFERAWRNIAWVRYQAIERCAEAEDEASDLLDGAE